MTTNDIYQAHILDHAQRPRNKGSLERPDVSVKGRNPSCGDTLVLELTFSDGVISEVAFDGIGCAISQAAASMLSETIRGMSQQEAAALKAEDVYRLLGIPITTSREKCALLALRTLHDALGVEDESTKNV
jgi:nitrogen fixation protein NifU and related proteins